MARCIICGDRILLSSSSGPAEDCDCGANLTRERWQQCDPIEAAEVEARRREWKAEQSKGVSDGKQGR